MLIDLLDEQIDVLYTVSGKVHAFRFSTGEKIETFGKVPNCTPFLSEDGLWIALRNTAGLMEIYNLRETKEPFMRIKWNRGTEPCGAFIGGNLLFNLGSKLVAIDLSTGQERVVFDNNPKKEDDIRFAVLNIATYKDEILLECNYETDEGKHTWRHIRLRWPDGKILNDLYTTHLWIIPDQKGGYYVTRGRYFYHLPSFPDTDETLGEEIQILKPNAKNVHDCIHVLFLAAATVVSPDGRYLSSGNICTGKTYLIDTETWKVIHEIDEAPYACHFSRMGQYFLISGVSKKKIVPIC